MKKRFFYTLTLAAAIAFTSCSGDGGKDTTGTDSTKTENSASADAASKKGKYPIKSGIITYDTEAMGMKMPTTLYFDDYGNTECQEVKMEMDMMGTKVTTHNLTITKDGYMYTLDLTNKTGTKMKMMSNAAGSMSGMDFSDLSEEFLKSMKMKREGKESVCGKDCDVYSIDNESMGMKGTFAIYNSIPMKTNIEAMGMPMTMNAVKFEENATIPADKFEIPADIQVKEM